MENLDETEKRERKEIIKFIVIVVIIIVLIGLLLPCIKVGADYLIKDKVDSTTIQSITRWWDH